MKLFKKKEINAIFYIYIRNVLILFLSSHFSKTFSLCLLLNSVKTVPRQMLKKILFLVLANHPLFRFCIGTFCTKRWNHIDNDLSPLL